MVMLINQDQDRVSTGFDQQVASVQAITNATEMWYDASHLNDTLPVVKPGSYWDDSFGNWFMYVKATATLTPGQLVSFAQPTSTGTVTSAGSTTAAVITNLTTTVNEVNNYWWSLDSAGTYSAGTTPYKQALRRIKASTIGANATFTLSVKGSTYGNNIFDPDQLNAVPANGSTFSVIRPFQVIVATATALPIGVALGQIVSGNFTIIQIAGLAMVNCNGTIPTVVGQQGTVIAGGVLSGTATTVATQQTTQGTSILPVIAYATATVSLIPCYVNFLGT